MQRPTFRGLVVMARAAQYHGLAEGLKLASILTHVPVKARVHQHQRTVSPRDGSPTPTSRRRHPTGLFRCSVNLALYLRQCVLENSEYNFFSLGTGFELTDDVWNAHRVGSDIVTEKLFRDYCTVLNDGYNSWHTRRTKEASGAQILQQYEK
jgi:hypothetical protein